MSEWNEKPECFGKLKKDKLEDCRECECTHDCMALTMTSNIGEMTSKQPSGFIDAGHFPVLKPPKIPTPDEMAKKCKMQHEALVRIGFTPDQATIFTVNLIASFIYR